MSASGLQLMALKDPMQVYDKLVARLGHKNVVEVTYPRADGGKR